MKLTDSELLELNELCGALVDGTSTAEQRARLAQMLRSSEAARRHYVRAMDQSASLHSYAAEMLADAPENRTMWALTTWKNASRSWWLMGALAAAATIGLVVSSRKSAPSATAAPVEIVARLTGAKSAEWAHGSLPFTPGAQLRRGQRLELTSGFAEITFDSGARVVLEGSASLDVNSAWDATLRRGTLKASVPPQAIGFHIGNAVVDVTDLGTEFTMFADGRGTAEVLVLKGEVEATPRGPGDNETILLRENEARRFAHTGGVSEVADSGKKFAHFSQPLAFDRISPSLRYVHWSFDERQGDLIAAEVIGSLMAAADATLKVVQTDGAPIGRSEGRFGGALRLDGQTEARANYPGLSSSLPRTIAFWVRVPEDAQLSDAYSIIAWATHLPKLGARPVQISWNRRPAEGPVGALRTDFGGGYAMGTTSLRDGRWHHVAIYFAAGEDPNQPVQVTQYVDGRLESSTIVRSKMSTQPGRGDAAVVDVLWLGCRLTGQTRRERFRGEVDELLIAERALEPGEIVSLMQRNRPVAALAMTR